jgi:C_GCAxxG_C_C family probable redox protein
MTYAKLMHEDFMQRNDYNCAEAMLSAANEAYELNLDERSLRMASPFGGGMGCEHACGALTGGLMALGCMRGRTVAHQDTRLAALRDAYVERFRERFGSIDCSTIKPAHRSETRGCAPVVEAAAVLLEEILSRPATPSSAG